MVQIKINVNNVINASSTIKAAKKEALSAKAGIRGTARFIDSRICSRNNLDNRLYTVCGIIGQAESKMERIANVVFHGASTYQMVDKEAVRKAQELLHMDKGSNDGTVSSIKKNRNRFRKEKNNEKEA